MTKKTSSVVILTLLSMIAFMTGCAGGGSPTAAIIQPGSPEQAVTEIIENWRIKSGPTFVVGADGSIAAQTEPTEARHISFCDLSGQVWKLLFTGVVYEDSLRAWVNTEYYFADNSAYGGLKVAFYMIRDDGVWTLNTLEITELPKVVVEQYAIKGVITDKVTRLPVSGARVEAYNLSTNIIAGYAVTDSTGFYQIFDLAPATYYLVINRDGYEPWTISNVIVR